MLTIGLHSLGHDTGACLWEDGELLYAIEAERLTRKRYETSIEAAIRAVVTHPAFDLDRLELVASSSHFSQRLLNITDPEAARQNLVGGRALHHATMSDFLGRRVPCAIVSHEVSHAALALQEAGWADRTLVLVNEGRGIFSRNAIYLYADGKLELKDYNFLPWFGTGFGWSAIGFLVGLGRHPGVAGKAMALAGFQPACPRELEAILDVRRDLPDLSREDQAEVAAAFVAGLGLNGDFKAKCRIVSALQSLFVDALVEKTCAAVAAYDARGVALSGGCALNIIANSALRENLPIPLYVPSACNDAGQALGAALYAHEFVLGRRPGAFPVYSIGAPITAESSAAYLKQRGISSQEATPDKVADILADGKVVAVARGLSEVGPRALGNRSLLADPNAPGIKSHVSEVLKGRESFRPLAPIMRAERFGQMFPDSPLSPAMLFNFDVRDRGFGGAAHVDHTARIQTVTARENPFIHSVLNAFEARSPSPALINTSLNSGGRPICQSEADVLDDFPIGTIGAYVLADRLVIAG